MKPFFKLINVFNYLLIFNPESTENISQQYGNLMQFMKKSNPWLKRLTFTNIFLIIICIVLMGGGHGYYTPTMIIFPLTMINLIWESNISPALFIIGMLLQFPVYGILIDMASRQKRLPLTLSLITIFHLSIIVFILSFQQTDFIR